MSSNPQQHGIANPVYLAGKLMVRGPAPITCPFSISTI